MSFGREKKDCEDLLQVNLEKMKATNKCLKIGNSDQSLYTAANSLFTVSYDPTSFPVIYLFQKNKKVSLHANLLVSFSDSFVLLILCLCLTIYFQIWSIYVLLPTIYFIKIMIVLLSSQLLIYIQDYLFLINVITNINTHEVGN